jgi:nucleotide-binding universal stress UspA family protein
MQILVATGGSPHSGAALHFSTYIMPAQHDEERLTVLTVLKHETERPQADAILARADQVLKAVISNVQTKVRIGHPAEEIIREAEDGGYNLVIVGEKQHHGLVTRFLLGSTAERVVEHAPCPVIIAKGTIGPIRRILLCDSGIEQPSLLSRFTAQFGDLLKGGEEVIVLHVMSQMSAGPGVSGKQLRAEAEELIKTHAPEGQLLERDIQLLERLNVQPQPKVRHGLVVDEILAEARGGHYDLVVIGAHQGQGWRNILLDDLAHQIIAQMDRPVLVVR